MSIAADGMQIPSEHRTTLAQMRENVEDNQQKSHLDFQTYFNSQSLLGGGLVRLGRLDEAEPLLLKAMEGLEQSEQEMP